MCIKVDEKTKKYETIKINYNPVKLILINDKISFYVTQQNHYVLK